MAGETRITVAKNRPLQRRIKTHGWTEARRREFLQLVAASCNIEASCAAVEMTKNGFYALRARDPAFSEQFRIAMLAGYERLETELLRKAIATVEDGPICDDGRGEATAGQLTIDQAIRLLDRHKATLHGKGIANSEAQYRATQAETDAALIKGLDALKRRHERKA